MCKKRVSNACYFSSVNEIAEGVWQELQCEGNLYFQPKYLAALEKGNPQIQFAYVLLLDDAKKAVALATIQVIDFHLDSVQNNLQSVVEWVRCMGRRIHLLSSQKPFKILTCGNTFVSGEHGIFIRPDQDKKQVVEQLAKAIVAFEKDISEETINAFMLKDFVNESLFITDALYNEGYNSFNVDPNMVLTLEDDWHTFDDYLAALKTKFRVKARKALKQSTYLRIQDVQVDEIAQILPKMTLLYKTVSNKASFNLGDFNLETYKFLKENLKENYFIKTYWLEDKLVGFLSGIINQNLLLDAHFVGIDYQFNKDYAIYQRMLYDYISLAIEHKAKAINFGRTASEIKSSVGAVPQNLTIYLRHKKSIPNRILSLFLKRIQPTEFSLKKPFKAQKV
ncbi:peptidogalycan biosysnthesis protein [Tenacibaculum caenipelagi]|uniref:Peptidoglycan biosynthesis/recognition protein n=1 Tax=Tenacibaculum caenipelagi TaxID=1325435 RepID=A0A4R6TI45_9FLAO|nr:peptidogalycan biosysnthesis protein [Tenacibaculum caenipelagi]TDQ28910.1 peptidoglycan biosynthesis/recognition protein [Tenacibaculum caenipelagi]